jgi:hypothetical protein
MRTKTLLLTAAITAAGASASMAQVYSVNAVGYVNVSVPAGQLEIFANPLNATNSLIGTVLALPDSADGTAVYAFDVPTQNYIAENFIGGLGWLPGTTALPPGDGFFIQAPNSGAVNITFVGEVPQGHLVTPLPGPALVALKGSMVPQSARLGDTVTPAGTLAFPSEDGDAVFSWDVVGQTYKTDNYIGGLGWLGDSGDPAGPLISVGHGFFVQKAISATNTQWARDFSVNP